jgi:predicted MFS family arabinose efflux permease
MRNVILVGAFALLLLSPLSAVAQQKAAPAPPPPAATEGVTSAKVLAIGIGALLGAVAAQAIVAGEGVTLVGGAAGGLLAAWWYDNPGNGPTRAAMHARAEGPEPARAERLALAR